MQFVINNLEINKIIRNIFKKKKNTSILLWNYKGHRLIKSWTTFRTLDNDIEILINYIKKDFPNYKFIVFVLSFGGYSTIRIIKIIKYNVILIYDRWVY